MNWDIKLCMLIDSLANHSTMSVGLSCNDPIDKEEVDLLSRNLPFPLPDTLKKLYTISDGVIIGVHFIVYGLIDDKFGSTIATINGLFLEFVNNFSSGNEVLLVFGTDGASGDLLCLTKKGSVISISPDNPASKEVVAHSMEEFLDTVCLGQGYIQFYQPTSDNFWIPILKEFGFI
jgi:hypothetical protein